jgi:hypothetical protein
MHSSQPDSSDWRASPTCDAPLRARQDAISAQALDEVCSQCCLCGAPIASLAVSSTNLLALHRKLCWRRAPDAESAWSGAERAVRRAAAEPVPARHQRAPRPGAAPAARPHLLPHLLTEGRLVPEAGIGLGSQHCCATELCTAACCVAVGGSWAGPVGFKTRRWRGWLQHDSAFPERRTLLAAPGSTRVHGLPRAVTGCSLAGGAAAIEQPAARLQSVGQPCGADSGALT